MIRDHMRKLVLEWLITYGKDWIEDRQARGNASFNNEMGRMGRMGYIKFREQAPFYEYKLTDKALKLLEEQE